MTRMIEEARCILTRLWADAVWGNRPAALSFRPARPRHAARPMPHPSRPPEAVPAAPWHRQKPRQISFSGLCRGTAKRAAMKKAGSGEPAWQPLSCYWCG